MLSSTLSYHTHSVNSSLPARECLSAIRRKGRLHQSSPLSESGSHVKRPTACGPSSRLGLSKALEMHGAQKAVLSQLPFQHLRIPKLPTNLLLSETFLRTDFNHGGRTQSCRQQSHCGEKLRRGYVCPTCLFVDFLLNHGPTTAPPTGLRFMRNDY